MDFKTQRSIEQFQALQSEWEIRNDKLAQIRNAYAIETSPAIKFQLQHQIKDEESAIADLEVRLTAIEDSLNSNDNR